MEAEAAVLPVALRVGACLAYILVIGHSVWVFGLPSPSTPARLWDVCKTVAKNVLKCRCCTGRRHRVPGRLLDALVRARMDDYKLRQSLKVFKIGAHIFTACVVMLVIWFEFGGQEPRRVARLMTAALVVYILLLLVAWECARLTVFRLNVMYALVMSILMSLLILNFGDPAFFFNLGLRMTMRFLFAMLYLDYRKAAGWNIAFSSVTCWRYKFNESALSGTHDHYWTNFMLIEFTSCTFLVVVLYCVEKCLEAHLKLQIVLEHQSTASLKLLSFQCDAVVWLTPNLHIDGPARQFSELLLLEVPHHHLDGREFQMYVADENDRERFRDFIATSTATQGTEVIPAVLHVSLRDATNTSISVEVFHVHCIDFQGREKHLLGICENASREARQRRYDEPHRNEQHHQHAELPRGRAHPTGSSLPSVDENSSTSGLSAVHPVGASFNLEARDSPRSDSNVGELLLSRLSEVLIKFDVFSTNFAMSECSLAYDATEGERAPGLMSLLTSTRIAGVRQWAEANANCAVGGHWPDHVSRDAGPLALHLSGGLSIAANSAKIKFPPDFPRRGSRHAILRLRGITVNPILDEAEHEPAEDAPMPSISSNFQNDQQEPPAAHDAQISHDAQQEPEPVQFLQACEPQQEPMAAHFVHISNDAQHEPEPVQIGKSQQEHEDEQILQLCNEPQHVPATKQSLEICHLTRL